jgi:PBS lyase HEAT-like repeat
MTLRFLPALVVGLAISLAGRAAPARADLILLRTGGEIRGELLSEAGSSVTKSKIRRDTLTMRTISGATVSVGESEVESVVRRRLVVEDYETLRRATPDTAQAQWDLAEWCRQKSLGKERETHLRKVVELDPEHTAAHRALGHVRHQGQWASHEEIMISRGFVKYKGKFLLPQEIELIQQDERVSEAEKGWFKRVKMWQGWLDSDRPDRRAEGLAQLQAIHDPDAVPALARTFKALPEPDQRMLYVEILSKILGDKPVQSLVLQSLWDESELIRNAAVQGIRGKDVSKSVPFYLRALKNGLNLIVNRAGNALGQLGSDAVVPQLIDALVTRHVYTELVPDGGIRSDMTQAPGGQPDLPANIELLLAAGQLPYGARVQYPLAPVRMKEITYEKDEQNSSVLAALNLLTGENFGFDEPTWHRWYNAQHNSSGSKKKKSKP